MTRVEELRVRIDEAVWHVHGKPLDSPPRAHHLESGLWIALATADYGQTTFGDDLDWQSEEDALYHLLRVVRGEWIATSEARP